MGARIAVAGLLGVLAGCAIPPVPHPACCSRPCLPPASPPACPTSPAAPVLADPGLAGPHPVEFYVQAALERNPEIRARERRVAAQDAVVPQVTSLPDPMLSNTFWPLSGYSPQTAAGRQPYGMLLSQQFPWFGKLRLRGEVARAETRIALTQLAETQLKVIEDVKAAYYEIAFNQQAIRITLDNEGFLKQYIKLAETRYTVSKGSYQDVLRAQVELSKLRDQLIQLRQQLRVAQADLAKLLSVPPETDLQAVEVQPPPVPEQMEQLYQVALATRPELQGRFQAILRDQQRVELAELNYCPDVTLGVNWSAITTENALARTANGHDFVGVLVGVNIPLWRNKLAAGVREARNRAEESARLYESARDDTFRLVRRLSVQARALGQQAELFRKDIVPRAEQTLRVSAADYRVGKVDALTVLDNYTQLLRFRIQLVRLEAAQGQALAALERVVGIGLAQLPTKQLPPPRPLPH